MIQWLRISDLEDKLSLINGDMPIIIETPSGTQVHLTLDNLDKYFHVDHKSYKDRKFVIKCPLTPEDSNGH